LPMYYPPDLTKDQLCTYFPRNRPPIKEGTFELGLVLAGTLTAGAYTAGVLDYLFQALDAWQCAKNDDSPHAPRHEVVISTLAGASGGGINGAIFLRAAGWQFPHGPHKGNPFYKFWLDGSTFEQLLAPGPANGIPGLSSLLNCASIDVHASETVEFVGNPLGTDGSPRQRAYLSDPLRLFVTVGNLVGVPYKIKLAGETALSHTLCAHGDYLRFALAVKGGVANNPPYRPDELALQSTAPAGTPWTYLRDVAVATSAMPFVFLARPLVRQSIASAYRVAVVPDDQCGSEVVQLVPDWKRLLTGEPDPRQTTFLNVDGGTFNNEPLELVRTALAGFVGRNERKPAEADRAVILIDPFSDAETLDRPQQGSLAEVAGALVTAFIQQARFKPEDIALAYAEKVYSRFLIAPVGPGPKGVKTEGQGAIAASALGGFGGFVHPSFADYDFCLGRLNAHKFLAEHLALPLEDAKKNPVFKDKWTGEQIKEYAFTSNGIPYLPVIPLMPHLRERPRLPDWPRLGAAPDLRDAIEARLQSVYELAIAEIRMPWWKKAILKAYLWFGWRVLGVRGTLRDMAFDAIKDGLVSRGLLAKPPP
jgi:patatin-like phospholipase